MKYAHLLSAFYFEPWNLRPDFHSNFGRVLQSYLTGEANVETKVFTRRSVSAAFVQTGQTIVGPADDSGNPIVAQMESFCGVAVIPVCGVLGKRLAMLDLYCGGCDYDHLTEFFRMALSDPRISTVILNFDTPGGSCRGLPECAAALAELASQKHVIAYSEGLCCSAGFYLACYASEFYASPSAAVGNIGSVMACLDNSREWELKGWKLELFASGALKGAGFDGKAWTDAEREFFNGVMLKKFAEFQAVVRTNRPQVAEECFDGRWLDGDIAPAFGLTDGTLNCLEEVVSIAIQDGK